MKKIISTLLLLAMSVRLFAASALTSETRLTLKHTQEISNNIGFPKDIANIDIEQFFSNGNSSATAQTGVMFYVSRDLTTGSTDTYRLVSSHTNNLGETVNFARIKTILIRNNSDVASLSFGNATDNPWGTWSGVSTATVIIPKEGFVYWQAPIEGWLVSSGTADRIMIQNNGLATANYDLCITGCSQ